MKIFPLVFIKSKDFFKIAIISIYYNEVCHPWDLISFSYGEMPFTVKKVMEKRFQFLGKIFVKSKVVEI